MRRFDFILYALVLGVILWALAGPDGETGNSPEPLPDHVERDGPMLPDPSVFDERILVMVEEPQDGIGTAFAINRSGQWLTARHVVEGCREVSLLVAPGRYVPVQSIALSRNTDLALLTTGRSPRAVDMDLESPLLVGEEGFHVGYPAGRPGEVATRLLARSKLLSRGLRRTEEDVIAWAEVGRTRGLNGSLGGLSGGPVFGADGQVRGVIVAESPRRGRIYTTAPSSITRFLSEQQAQPVDGPANPFTVRDYGSRADDARNSLQVVKVACRVS